MNKREELEQEIQITRGRNETRWQSRRRLSDLIDPQQELTFEQLQLTLGRQFCFRPGSWNKISISAENISLCEEMLVELWVKSKIIISEKEPGAQTKKFKKACLHQKKLEMAEQLLSQQMTVKFIQGRTGLNKNQIGALKRRINLAGSSEFTQKGIQGAIKEEHFEWLKTQMQGENLIGKTSADILQMLQDQLQKESFDEESTDEDMFDKAEEAFYSKECTQKSQNKIDPKAHNEDFRFYKLWKRRDNITTQVDLFSAAEDIFFNSEIITQTIQNSYLSLNKRMSQQLILTESKFDIFDQSTSLYIKSNWKGFIYEPYSDIAYDSRYSHDHSLLCAKCHRKCQIFPKDHVLSRFRTPLFKLLKLFLYFLPIHTPNAQIVDELDIDKNVVTKAHNIYLSAIELSYDLYLQNVQKFGENGSIIEIDECCFKRKYNRGRHKNQEWVLGICERKSSFQRVGLFIIPDRTRQTLVPIIKAFVSTNCKILCTDKWKSYSSLTEEGYNHRTVNHSKNFVERRSYQKKKKSHGNQTTGRRRGEYTRQNMALYQNFEGDLIHTQMIESVWSHIKRILRKKTGQRRAILLRSSISIILLTVQRRDRRKCVTDALFVNYSLIIQYYYNNQISILIKEHLRNKKHDGMINTTSVYHKKTNRSSKTSLSIYTFIYILYQQIQQHAYQQLVDPPLLFITS
ncbi:hypothetical protein ABPG72_013987 [Tetrahymena utriculariae]